MRVLTIEDSPDIIESISLFLKLHCPDLEMLSTHLGKTGVELATTEAPDLIILDLGLPDIDGLEVMKQIRRFSSVPVIILSVKGDKADIMHGFEAGADDYVVKPCGQDDLLAHIKTIMQNIGQSGVLS